ncbi:hypothetical protein [Streptomyces sp. NPDC056061]|uniref:hypothetical protein n=1 Tax=Streptomyces sp. NPDC056061 TaxID=3345700 RepID=UPI0035E0BC15
MRESAICRRRCREGCGTSATHRSWAAFAAYADGAEVYGNPTPTSVLPRSEKAEAEAPVHPRAGCRVPRAARREAADG